MQTLYMKEPAGSNAACMQVGILLSKTKRHASTLCDFTHHFDSSSFCLKIPINSGAFRSQPMRSEVIPTLIPEYLPKNMSS